MSAASLWEASIKRAKGRLATPSDLSRWVRKERFVELPTIVTRDPAFEAFGVPVLPA